MLNTLPIEIKTYCEKELGNLTGFQTMSGGCINNGGRLKTTQGVVFIKWNSARSFPGMFTAEAKGLNVLVFANCIRIPQVIASYEGDSYSCLLLEWIDSSSKQEDYWSALGCQLAALHSQTRDSFGLDHNNYIGSLPQSNAPNKNWVDFFVIERLMPQVKLALENGKMTRSDLRDFERLYERLPSLLTIEAPSLTHGDLWSGNLMSDDHGLPILIDPAVAYTHREVDLAFTTLFGGFDQQFYASYNEIFPLESGYKDRLDIYNLYPLLVHVNLFGGGYYNQVKSILQRFI